MTYLLEDFRTFLDKSPTSWHAVEEIGNRLASVDFHPLAEGDSWQLENGKKYFVQRGGLLCAFVIPTEIPKKTLILASHTDSPALKIKPRPEIHKENMTLFGVEVYGGPLITSWLNRDLGIAGRIIVMDHQKKLEEKLVFIDDEPLFIPQLPIHLDREVNEKGLVLNKQDHLAPILTINKEGVEGHYLETILHRHASFNTLLGFDLFLVPLESARYMGVHSEMLASYRLDNLAAAHACLTAIGSTKKKQKDLLQIAIFWDHEEIGSNSQEGAGSPFVTDLLERIYSHFNLSREVLVQTKSHSLIVSVDMSHGFNPNYPAKFDSQHQLLLGGGVAIKQNANHKYASDARTSAIIMKHAQELGLPLQPFVGRSDMTSGSTVGPIMAQATGIPTVDIGIPLLSMHSVREVIATKDYVALCHLLTHLLEESHHDLSFLRSF